VEALAEEWKEAPPFEKGLFHRTPFGLPPQPRAESEVVIAEEALHAPRSPSGDHHQPRNW